jgi:hypothetical protein
MKTALYSATDAQGDIMQGTQEESLPASDGFLIADANQQVTLEQVQQKADAADVLPLYVRQYVKKKDLKLLLIACLQ